MSATVQATFVVLTIQINKIISHPHTISKFLTQGITYIKPKNKGSKNPANYFTIACHPTLYNVYLHQYVEE